MKRCLKCGAKMIDGDIHTSFGGAFVSVDGAWRRKNLGRVQCMICTKCGAIELSVDLSRHEEIKSLSE